MNISGINFESIVDGEGVRVVIYVSGCKHNCKGCHNPETHSFDAGQPFTESLQKSIIKYLLKTPFISGITLSGGDPMYSAESMLSFIREIKKNIATSIWLYSGFTFEEIQTDKTMAALLKEVDVLVDGEFILEQRDPTLRFKGSQNQRIIDVQQSLKNNKIILWRD